MFCTLFMGFIDLDTLEMEFCNAGHTRTLIDGEFLAQDPQLIAGIVPDYVWHTQKLQLHNGAGLLLYTDGVTEARDESRALFGEARLQAWMKQRPVGTSCREDCEDLLQTLASFRGKAKQNDDIAIMSIKII
jgi:sigma-B regulation protein RsbU (phosphoserine phosphatase)